jgi:hypothetical protein
MSHQNAKLEAQRVIKELLAKHPPGMVVMILRELKTLLRATKDLTVFKILALLAIVTGSTASAQITSISSANSAGGLGGVTTIAPCGSGYSYATIGGPHGGTWGNVQVSPGAQVSMAVSPLGGVLPIVTPAQPMSAPDPLMVPQYIPVPVSMPIHTHNQAPRKTAPVAMATPTQKRISKAQRNATLAEFNQLYYGIAPSDRKQFWDDFYADWKVAPKTPIPTEYMIPYLRMWSRTHGIDISKSDAKSDAK